MNIQKVLNIPTYYNYELKDIPKDTVKISFQSDAII
jgi:hypothetical protein